MTQGRQGADAVAVGRKWRRLRDPHSEGDCVLDHRSQAIPWDDMLACGDPLT